jgi:hypothetical protein
MFPWKNIIVVVFVFCAILFALIVEWKIQDGKLKRVDTYSYRRVFKWSLIYLAVGFSLCILFYIYSKSFEATITVGALILSAIIVASLNVLLWEYQTKRRGGRKIE